MSSQNWRNIGGAFSIAHYRKELLEQERERKEQEAKNNRDRSLTSNSSDPPITYHLSEIQTRTSQTYE